MFSERQTEIIQVALELISEKGIQNLTIKNLSKKIGISEPAIYRHFNSKIDILIAILDSFTIKTKELFAKELQLQTSALEKIEHLYTKHFEYLSDSPSVATVLFSEEIFKNDDILIAKISAVINEKDKILQQIISDGQKNGEITNKVDTDYLSTIIIGSL